MLKVKYNPKLIDSPEVKYAVQYSDKQFSELSKIWADLGLELLVHKQEVDPMIDIIQRGEDGYIVDAMTIGVGEWFIFDPEDKEDWYIATNKEFEGAYVVVEEEASHVQA